MNRRVFFPSSFDLLSADNIRMKAFTVLITGTSKGFGFDLVRIFLKNHPTAVIYATSRDTPEQAQLKWTGIDHAKAVKCRQL